MSRREDDTGAGILAQLRNIVAHHQHAKVRGVRGRVDAFTASAVVSVHDNLNPANQAKLVTMLERRPFLEVAELCFKVLRRHEERAA